MPRFTDAVAIARMTETELADTLATIHQSYNPEVHA